MVVFQALIVAIGIINVTIQVVSMGTGMWLLRLLKE